jgi:hypothetical protein
MITFTKKVLLELSNSDLKEIDVTYVTVNKEFHNYERKHFIKLFPEVWCDMQRIAIYGIKKLIQNSQCYILNDMLEQTTKCSDLIVNIFTFLKKVPNENYSLWIRYLLADVNPSTNEKFVHSISIHNYNKFELIIKILPDISINDISGYEKELLMELLLQNFENSTTPYANQINGILRDNAIVCLELDEYDSVIKQVNCLKIDRKKN